MVFVNFYRFLWIFVDFCEFFWIFVIFFKFRRFWQFCHIEISSKHSNVYLQTQASEISKRIFHGSSKQAANQIANIMMIRIFYEFTIPSNRNFYKIHKNWQNLFSSENSLKILIFVNFFVFLWIFLNFCRFLWILLIFDDFSLYRIDG